MDDLLYAKRRIEALERQLDLEHQVEEILCEMDTIDTISDLFLFLFQKVPSFFPIPFTYHLLHIDKPYRREDDIRNLAHIFRASIKEFIPHDSSEPSPLENLPVVFHDGWTFEFNTEKDYLPIIIENAIIGAKKSDNSNILLGYIEVESAGNNRHTAERRARIVRRIMRSTRTHLERIRSYILLEEHSLLAFQDHLTEIYNRRGFFRECKKQRTDAGHKSWWVIVLDLDFFKRINDTFGHGDGDRALCFATDTVSNTLAWLSWLGIKPVFGRVWGEEFSIYLHSVQKNEVIQVAEALRVALESGVFSAENGTPIRITGSFGVYCSDLEESVESGMAKADIALYSAKGGGRNRVELFSAQSFINNADIPNRLEVRHQETTQTE